MYFLKDVYIFTSSMIINKRTLIKNKEARNVNDNQENFRKQSEIKKFKIYQTGI